MNPLDNISANGEHCCRRSRGGLLPLLVVALAMPLSGYTQNYLVNDTFSDTDRIGGQSGSGATASSPSVSTPTSSNTQWVSHIAGQLVASSTGMLWTMNSSSRSVMGYFPTVTVGSAATTFSLTFTTGTLGSNAGNLRIGLFDSTPAGMRTTDGYSSTDATSAGDLGYGIFSGSNLMGNSTSNVSFNTRERTNLSTDLLGTDGQWTNLSVGSYTGIGYFQSNTTYTLAMTLMVDSGILNYTTAISGGNFSNWAYTVSDASPSTLNFDMLVFRLGGGSNQVNTINFNSFTVSQIPEPSTYAAMFGLAALGLVAYRRRRAAKV